jgi:hypothetical protein
VEGWSDRLFQHSFRTEQQQQSSKKIGGMVWVMKTEREVLVYRPDTNHMKERSVGFGCIGLDSNIQTCGTTCGLGPAKSHENSPARISINDVCRSQGLLCVHLCASTGVWAAGRLQAPGVSVGGEGLLTERIAGSPLPPVVRQAFCCFPATATEILSTIN